MVTHPIALSYDNYLIIKHLFGTAPDDRTRKSGTKESLSTRSQPPRDVLGAVWFQGRGSLSCGKRPKMRDCSIATGADSKIARQEQGESTWDPLNASELAPNSANGLIPRLIAWAKSQPPGNVAIVSENEGFSARATSEGRRRKRSAEEAESAESLLIGTRATDVGDRENHGELACLLEQLGTKKRSYCQE